MATPNIYFDACAFIEIAKGQFSVAQSPDRVAETKACRQLLTLARNGEIQIYTSTLTIAEAVHIGDVPPKEEAQKFLERLVLSGRDGVIMVSPDPFIVEMARDLTWKNGIAGGVADRIHIASALHAKCDEMISVDGKLAKRANTHKIEGLSIIAAINSRYLPRQDNDLFEK